MLITESQNYSSNTQTTQIETNFLLQKPAKPISKNCLPADDISSLKTSVPFGYGYLYPAPSTSHKKFTSETGLTKISGLMNPTRSVKLKCICMYWFNFNTMSSRTARICDPLQWMSHALIFLHSVNPKETFHPVIVFIIPNNLRARRKRKVNQIIKEKWHYRA